MKTNILSIAHQLKVESITTDEAKKQLLILFSVVGQSKQLVCDVCGSTDVIAAPPMGKNCNRCNPLY